MATKTPRKEHNGFAAKLDLLGLTLDELKKPMQLTLVRPAEQSDLKRKRESVTVKTQTWRELSRYLAAVMQGQNVAPYELGLIIDFEDPQTQADLKALKNPRLTLLTKVRALVKALELNDKVELHQYGQKLAIVGKQA